MNKNNRRQTPHLCCIGLPVMLAIALLPALPIQSPGQESDTSHHDPIWKLATDDSTRALARLFELKRLDIRHELKRSATGIVTSGLLIGTAWLVITSGRPVLDVLGIVPLFLGSGGLVFYGAKGSIHLIRLQLYSIRRFQRIAEEYHQGIPIPDFYVRKLTIYEIRVTQKTEPDKSVR